MAAVLQRDCAPTLNQTRQGTGTWTRLTGSANRRDGVRLAEMMVLLWILNLLSHCQPCGLRGLTGAVEPIGWLTEKPPWTGNQHDFSNANERQTDSEKGKLSSWLLNRMTATQRQQQTASYYNFFLLQETSWCHCWCKYIGLQHTFVCNNIIQTRLHG